jgi:hypothetical protein
MLWIMAILELVDIQALCSRPMGTMSSFDRSSDSDSRPSKPAPPVVPLVTAPVVGLVVDVVPGFAPSKLSSPKPPPRSVVPKLTGIDVVDVPVAVPSLPSAAICASKLSGIAESANGSASAVFAADSAVCPGNVESPGSEPASAMPPVVDARGCPLRKCRPHWRSTKPRQSQSARRRRSPLRSGAASRSGAIAERRSQNRPWRPPAKP